MKRFDSARLLSLATLASLAACSGGGGATADATAGGDFLVLKTEPVNGQIIYLNDPVTQGRNAQRSFLSVGFRDVDTSYREWLVRAALQLLDEHDHLGVIMVFEVVAGCPINPIRLTPWSGQYGRGRVMNPGFPV